jgi:hypothetical protein
MAPNSTDVLRVQVDRFQHELLFYTGMWMATPMGEGVVEAILPLEEKLVIKLPFGKMYATLSRAVHWRSSENSVDIHHSGALCHRWAGLPGVLNLSDKTERQIDSLIAGLNDIEGDGDAVATDADAVDGENENLEDGDNEIDDEDDESTVTPLDVAETASQISVEPSENKAEGAVKKAVTGRSARLRGDAPMEVEGQEGSKNKEKGVDQAANGDGTTSPVRTTKAGNEKGAPMFGHPLGAIVSMLEGSASSVAGDLDKSRGGPKERINIRGLNRLGGNTGVEKAQLKESNKAVGVCSGVRNSLIRKRLRSAFLTPDLMPLVFAPPSSLPAVMETVREMPSKRIDYQLSALDEGKLVGSSSTLGWMDADDVTHMKEVMKSLENEVRRLEGERRSYMGEIQKKRQRGVEMTQQTASLRLMLFTRRVRRRNNMNAAGYTSPVPPFDQKAHDADGATAVYPADKLVKGMKGRASAAQSIANSVAASPMHANGETDGFPREKRDIPGAPKRGVSSNSSQEEGISSSQEAASSSSGQGNGVLGHRRNPSRHACTKAAEELQPSQSSEGSVPAGSKSLSEAGNANEADEDEEEDEEDGIDGAAGKGAKGGVAANKKKKKQRRR